MRPFDPGCYEWLLKGTKIIQRNVCLYWCQGNKILVVQMIVADYIKLVKRPVFAIVKLNTPVYVG